MILRFCLVATALAALPVRGDDDKPAAVVAMKLEVEALLTLRTLDLTPDQLRGLANFARGAADSRARDDARVDPKYADSLTQLYTALASGDEDRISAAQEEFDSQSESENAEVDDEVEPTEVAKLKAARAVRVLNVRQLTSWVSTLSINDPVELLTEGFDAVRAAEDREEAQNRLLDEILDSMPPGPASNAKSRIASLLKRVAELSDGDFKAKREELNRSASDAVGEIDPVQAMTRGMERSMAQLLSNPRLAEAVAVASKWKPRKAVAD